MMSNNRRSNPVTIKPETASSGILIKTEPGASGLIIKTEPGSSPGRLSSFKLPRDLTLGGQSCRKAPKKVYTPNLGVIRNKKENLQNQPVVSRGRGRARGRGDRSKNDLKKNNQSGASNYIQTSGVFSEGVAAGLKRASSYGNNTRENESGSNVMQKPKLNLKRELKIDKDEEKAKIQDLLQIYDNTECPDDATTLENMPNTLPIMKKENILNIKKEEYGSTKYLTVQAITPAKYVNGVHIKVEPMEVDKKDTPIHDQNIQRSLINLKLKGSTLDATVGSLFSVVEPTLFLLQLPDTLPGQGPEVESLKQPEPGRSIEDKTTNSNVASNFCTLKQLDEGQLGRVILYKSGRAKLVLGETKFDLDLGTQSTFLQEVMSVNVNKEQRSGDMINLGSVGAKLIATPDWEEMI